MSFGTCTAFMIASEHMGWCDIVGRDPEPFEGASIFEGVWMLVLL